MIASPPAPPVMVSFWARLEIVIARAAVDMLSAAIASQGIVVRGAGDVLDGVVVSPRASPPVPNRSGEGLR